MQYKRYKIGPRQILILLHYRDNACRGRNLPAKFSHELQSAATHHCIRPRVAMAESETEELFQHLNI